MPRCFDQTQQRAASCLEKEGTGIVGKWCEKGTDRREEAGETRDGGEEEKRST